MGDADELYDRLLTEVEAAQGRLRDEMALLAPERRAGLLAYGFKRSTDAGQRGEGWTLYRSFVHHAAFQLIFGLTAWSPDMERAALLLSDPAPAEIAALWQKVVEDVQAIMAFVNAELRDDELGERRMELSLRIHDQRSGPVEGPDGTARSLHHAMSMILSGMPDP